MTPYATPHTGQTPRYGQQTPGSASHMSNGPFLHPSAVTPSQRTPSYRNHMSSQSPMIPQSPVPSPGSQSSYSSSRAGGGGYNESLRFQPPESPRYSNRSYSGDRYGGSASESMDWQKAAEAWAARSRGKGFVFVPTGTKTNCLTVDTCFIDKVIVFSRRHEVI